MNYQRANPPEGEAKPGGLVPAAQGLPASARRLLQRGRRLCRSRRRAAVGLSARPARISARFDQAPMAHPEHRRGVLGLRRIDDVDQDAALYVDGPHSDRPQRRQDRGKRQRHAGRRTGTRVHADPIRALAEPYHRRARGLGSQARRGPRLLRAEGILADPLPARPRPLERRACRAEQQSQLRGRGGAASSWATTPSSRSSARDWSTSPTPILIRRGRNG